MFTILIPNLLTSIKLLNMLMTRSLNLHDVYLYEVATTATVQPDI